MRRRLWLLPFLLAFLLGALGHLLFRPVRVPEEKYTVTLVKEEVSRLLLPAIPTEGTPLFLAGRKAMLLGCEAVAGHLFSRSEGKTLVREATLSATVFFTLSVNAREKEGRLYLGDQMLLSGDEVVLTGENFRISAYLTGFERLF